MELIGLERNGSIEQAHLNMMGFKLPEPEEENAKIPIAKQPTPKEKRGMSAAEWAEYKKGAQRSIAQLARDLERQGLTEHGPVIGREFEPNRIFA